MIKKNAKLLLILIALIAFTVVFSVFRYKQNHPTEKQSQKQNVTEAVTVLPTELTTDVVNVESPATSSSQEVDEHEHHEHQTQIQIQNVSDKLRKTVKDFTEIENKVYEVINAFYPTSTNIKYERFAQDAEKYSYTFTAIEEGDVEHTIIIYYWLSDKTLSYQHY